MTNECGAIRSLLTLYVGNDVDRDERGVVEAHVAVCAACAGELEEYRTAMAALTSAMTPAPEPPDGMSDRLWEAVRREARATPPPAAIRAFFVRAAAVLVIGVSVGFAANSLRPAPAAPDAGRGAVAAPSAPGTFTDMPLYGSPDHSQDLFRAGDERLVDTGGGTGADRGAGVDQFLRRMTAFSPQEDFGTLHLQRAEIVPVKTGLIRW